jgi:hypothetical protein
MSRRTIVKKQMGDSGRIEQSFGGKGINAPEGVKKMIFPHIHTESPICTPPKRHSDVFHTFSLPTF